MTNYTIIPASDPLCQELQDGYSTHTASGLSSDRKHTVSRAYINEHYTDVQESGEVIVCNDDRGNEHKFDAVKGLDGWFVENRKR
jgi:hypothetical protein